MLAFVALLTAACSSGAEVTPLVVIDATVDSDDAATIDSSRGEPDARIDDGSSLDTFAADAATNAEEPADTRPSDCGPAVGWEAGCPYDPPRALGVACSPCEPCADPVRYTCLVGCCVRYPIDP